MIDNKHASVQSELRGWETVELRSEMLTVTVVPHKGGDIVSVVHRPTSTELMWRPRWGLRRRGGFAQSGSGEAITTDAYGGGWQTMFPNGGDASVENGVEWGFHGEVWVTAFELVELRPGAVVLQGDLTRSPFRVVKTIALDGSRLRVSETVTNLGRDDVEVMWGHHPAFGAPFIGPETHIETSARIVQTEADARQPAEGRRSGLSWPHYRDGSGGTVDLSVPALPESGESRMAFLAEFTGRPWIRLTNRRVGLQAELTWDGATFPYAWYWNEAGGRRGYPWYGAAYVLALEPCSSWPARGLTVVRETTGTQLLIRAGETRSTEVELVVSPAPALVEGAP